MADGSPARSRSEASAPHGSLNAGPGPVRRCGSSCMSTPSLFPSSTLPLFPTGLWGGVLVDGGSSVLGLRGEEVEEFVGEGVGGGPAEVVGDHDGPVATPEPHGPEPFHGAAVGAGGGVVDLDVDAGG